MALRQATARQKDAVKASNDSEFIDGVADQKYDSSIVSYYGTDQNQNSLCIKINRRANKPSELVLFFKLEDGHTYELPDHPNTVIRDVGNSTWSCAGLKISVLQSSRRTRILFNGLLRKGSRRDIDDEPDDDIHHVRLNCIFIANTKPYLQKDYWSSNLLSETLTHNSWNKSKWDQFSKNLNIDQADQYGSMMAEVTFEDSSSKQLYLRGMRQSQWGKFDATYLERNICITATDTLGIAFYIRSSNIKDGVKNIQLGHVKNPEGNVHSIDSLSFDGNHLMDRYNSGFNDFEFQFSANKRQYVAVVKLRRETQKTLFGGNPWDSQYTFCQFELTLDNISGVGMIQIWQPYAGPYYSIEITKKANGWKEYNYTSVQENQLNDDDHFYILPFEDPRCQIENFVGGKGASLADLTAIKVKKFTVPKGFCVTAKALDVHIKYNEWLMDKIDELVNICCGGNANDIKEHCKKMATGFQNTPMAEPIRDAIVNTLENFESNIGKNTYAVRSSAVGEDSEETSAAGQNSTFLAVKSDAIVESVTHCWASLYTYQSVEYRRQHGLPIKASMGVCIQQMVNAEAAGVMFTRYPLTGNPREIVISSNYGLGESVVSALADPDTIIIQRNHQKNSLNIKSSRIGTKSQKVTVNSNTGGTVHSDVSEDDKSKLSISEELAVMLAEIGVTLDQLYNSPRDIEWAVSQGRVYLLQCRPVTALEAWTDFELIHELGSGVPSDSDILTLANVGEVLPMVATPLTISTIIHVLNLSTESSYVGYPVNDTYKQHMFVVNSKCFLNYATSFLRHADDKISLGSKLAEIAVCGHLINTPEINEIGLKRNGGPFNGLNSLKIMAEIFTDFLYKSQMIKQAQQIVEHCRTIWKSTPNLSSPDKCYKWLDELVREYIKLSTIHIHTTKCSVSFQVFVLSILAEGNEELSIDHFSDIAVLLGSCNTAISAQVPLALKEIAETIKQCGLSEDFQGVDPSEALSWLLTYCPKAHELVQEFITIHGHRGIEEFELITETWGMKPEKFLSIIQSMLNSTTDNSTKTTELSPRETVALLKTPGKSSTRWILSKLLSSMRSTVSEREYTKCLLIELVYLMRMGYRNLSASLVREGRLPDQELVFFFTHEELAEIIGAPCPSLVRKAVRRRKLRPTLQQYQYSEISYGLPKPIEVRKHQLPASVVGARVQGTSVCNGMALGRACVALSLEEAAAIRPGDILITHATDIGWSPYFPLLAGVVTELGGLISHGTVVAREYGIPCIVSAKQAIATFNTGDTVKLDGYAGTIEVVDKMHAKVP